MTSMTHAIAQLPPAPTRADWKALAVAGALALAVLPALVPAGSATAYSWKSYSGAGMDSAENTIPVQAKDAVTDDSLKSFKTAKATVMAIKDEWQNRVERGEVDPDDETAQEVVRIQMTATIEQNGLSVDEYNRIDKALKSDEELRQRYHEMP